MHVRFDEDSAEQELTRRLASSAAAQRPIAAVACAALTAVNVVRTDFDSGDQCYVFGVAASTDSTSVAASLSNNSIKLYSAKDAAGLSFIGSLNGHSNIITSISYAMAATPYALYSSSEDGTVRGWDARTGQQAESFSAGSNKLWSFSLAGNYVAAGSNGQVLFWDRRNGKQCAAFTDIHAEDVTQVMFHPTQQNKLLSASVDGLVAVFDLANGLDEDDGFMAALNLDNSVSSMGFYGQQAEKLWCLSHTETLHLWEWVAACDEESTGGQGVLGEDTQARATLTQASSTAPGAEPLGPGLDYLISCSYNSSADQLVLMAGNNQGAVGCFPVLEPTSSSPGTPCGFSSPKAVMSGAHDSVVRSVVWSDHGALITGGEDARLVQWAPQPAANGEQKLSTQKTGQKSAGAVKRKDTAGARHRQSPY